MITLEIVFYLPEVLSTPCGNHLCKNHVDVYATEEKMLFNGNYVRQRQLLDGCHSEINFEFLHKQYLLSSPHADSARVLLADSALTVGREKTFCRVGQVFFFDNGHNSGTKSRLLRSNYGC